MGSPAQPLLIRASMMLLATMLLLSHLATTAVSLLTATAVPTIATTTVLTTTAPMLLLQTTVPNTATTDPTGTPILLLQSTASNSAPTSAPTTANTTVAATSVFTTLTTAPTLLLHTTAPTAAFTSPVLLLHTTAVTTEITTPTTAATFSIAAVTTLTTTEIIASTTATTVSTTVTTVPNAASTVPTTNAIVPTITITVPTIAFTTSNTASMTEITAPTTVPITPTTAPTPPTNMTVFDGSCQPDNATCVTEFYPFGLLENDNVLTNIDDDTSEPIKLSETFKFYGQTINIIYVGSNGIISLNTRYNPPNPSSLPKSEFSFIAPYWADVDLHGIGRIYYRQTSNSTLLARTTSEIQAAFSVSQNVSNLFIATWVTVGYYPRMTDRINTFQCVLAMTSEAMSFVMFLYADGEIQWADGALAGINAGDGVNSITIPGSLTPNILNVSQTSNVGIPGIWMFQGQPSSYIFLQPIQPIVGKRQDVICSISVSLDLDIVDLGWLNEEVIVTNDSRVTIVKNNFTFNSSITGITTIIRFDPLLEIDEGNYTCYYSVENETETTTSIQLVPTPIVTVVALNPEEIGQLLIIDCRSTNEVPNAENQTVGDPLILRCDLNTYMLRNFRRNSVNFTWRSNNVILKMANQVRQPRDHYVISQLNTSNNGQEYKCEAMISTTPPINESGAIVLDLTVPDFTVAISDSQFASEEILVGNSQDIQCTVKVGFDGVELNSVIFNWLGPKRTPITNDSRVTVNPTYSSDKTFFSILQFSYLMESDDGTYTCCVMILSTNHSDSIELRKPNVPTPNVSIIVAHDDILVGQPFSLECIITTVRGINSQVNIIWSKGSDNEELKRENVSANVTTNSSVTYRDYLNISQITTDDDNKTYRCEVIINTSSPVTASDNYTLHVIAPNFSIAIAPNNLTHGAMVGDYQIIHCTINTVNGVRLKAVMVHWTGPEGTSISNNSRTIISPPTNSSSNSTNNFSISLEFRYLMQGDEGRYMCNVSILQANASITIEVGTLTVPIPTVSVYILTNQSAGEQLKLYCNITTVRGINSIVNITWLRDGSELEMQDIENITSDNNMQLYMTSYTIDHLRATDNERVYQCRVLIYSNTVVMASDNFTLNVTGIAFGDSKSDRSSKSARSTPSWMIVGIGAGVILIIATTLMCLLLLRKRSKNKILRMRTADFNLHSLSNPTYDMTLKNITGISKPISVEEWKKELAGYLIDYHSLNIKNTIASGKFGVVYKALYNSKEGTIIEVAVKTVKYFSSQTAESFVKECNIANKFDHPNVLSLIGACIIPEEDVPLMVMPYMHHGDVKSFLKSKRENNIKVEEYPSGLSEEILIKMCHDVAKGMEYLAIKHFVHRDLAARNCMLDQSMTTKVADFGLSRDVYVTEYYTTSHSTPLPVKWLAPESLFDRHFNEKSDVWAFGVTCWEVFSLGLQPYPLIGPSEIGDYIKSGKILDKPRLSSDKMYEMMKTCWKFKADGRPNFSDLVKTIDHLKSMPRMTQSKKFIKKESAAYLLVYS